MLEVGANSNIQERADTSSLLPAVHEMPCHHEVDRLKQIVTVTHDFEKAVKEQARLGVSEWFIQSNDAAVALYGGRDATLPLTYSELRDCLNNAPSFGIPGKTRVAIVVPVFEADLCAISILSVMQQNCIACPLDARLDVQAIKRAIKHLNCTVAVLSESLPSYKQIAKLLDTVVSVSRTLRATTVVVSRLAESFEWHGSFDSKKLSQQQDGEQFNASRTLLLLRTSGTTSTPKIVPLTALNLLYNAHAIKESLNLRSSDIGLNVMPYFHIGGIACALFTVLCAGSSVICMPEFDPASFLNRLQQDPQPTWYYAVPTIHKALLLHFNGKHLPGSKLRFIRSGAAHLPHKDAIELKRVFQCTVLPTYSMSECMPVASVLSNYDLSKEDSVGPPIGPSIEIVDPYGRKDPLPYGQVGEVVLKGPGVTLGYLDSHVTNSTSELYNIHNTTNDVLHEEHEAQSGQNWFSTGDLGTLDSDGWLFLKGRIKEMVKRGGEQVSLFEVDAAVLSCPGVDVAVAFGVPNPLWGEEVAVAVVPTRDSPVAVSLFQDPNSTSTRKLIEDFKNSVLSHARKELDQEFKQPVQVVVVESESHLPKGPTKKVLRSKMAETFNIKAVDLIAEKQLLQANLPMLHDNNIDAKQTGGDSTLVRPSRALYGIRFITALFVVNLHLGSHPYKWWTKLQNFSMNMNLFIMLAGLLLAGSTSRAISPDERLAFYVSRFSAAHPLFWFSILLALPVWFIRCYPGSPACGYTVEMATNTTAVEYSLLFIGSSALHAIGFQVAVGLNDGFYFLFNSPTWFSTAYYCLVLLFPVVDGWIRKFSSVRAVVCVCAFLVLLELGAVREMLRAVDVTGYLFISWIPTFFLGVSVWHLIVRLGTADPNSSQMAKYKLPIAVGTDVITILLFVYTLVALLFDCEEYFPQVTGKSYQGAFVCTPTTGITFEDWKATGRIRWGTLFGYLVGDVRASTPVLALWLFGLSHGHGITAKFLSLKFLASTLSPLAYPLYLLHVVIATYYWHITEGVEPQEFLAQQGSIPYPIPWYGVVIVVFVSLLLGVAFNRWINARCIPYAQKFFDCFFRWFVIIFTLGRIRMVSIFDQDSRGEQSVMATVVQVIRNLSGAVVEPRTSLEDIGLDSFGATALVGSLRAKLPDNAKNLRPSDVHRLGTVESLVAYLVDQNV